MKQFNLEEYLADPSKKVVTKEGRNARIICTDRVDPAFQIVALIESKWGESIIANTKDGKYFLNDVSDCDLFFAPIKHEGWTNVYVDDDKCMERAFIYKSEEEAKTLGMKSKGYVATAKIEWEEE